MEYESLNYTDKQQVEKLLATCESDVIIKALIGVVNGVDDRQWLEDICLRYISHPDYWVAKTAINSLGDIARIYKEASEHVILALKEVSNKDLKATVSDALEDIMLNRYNNIIKHKYAVKQQFLNSYGRYAVIDFEVSIDEGKEEKIIINYNADPRWEIACRAGIAIFYDYSLISCEFTITVNEIIWRPMDTNNLTVMYATIKGLAEAYEMEIPIAIDVPNESFVFPTRRS